MCTVHNSSVFIIIFIYISMEKESERTQNWIDKEDEALCNAYIKISKDHEINVKETEEKLWKSDAKVYNTKTKNCRAMSCKRALILL